MSGARPGSLRPAVGGTAAACGAAGVRVPPKRCPATRATSASSAIAATAQGSAEAADRCSVGAAAVVPTAVPQRWQNFAPGESSERQPVHAASATAAPHSEQKRPVTGAEQVGQVFADVAVVGMRQK